MRSEAGLPGTCTEIGSCLTRISLLSNAAEREISSMAGDQASLEKSLARISRISELSHSLVSSMDEIVWATNPVNDNLEEFATYLTHYAQEVLQMKGIACRLSLPASLPARAFNSTARHQLFLVVKEALNNIIKHSSATCVTLSLEVNSDFLKLEISDDGKGFQLTGCSHRGNGLHSMKKRVQEMGGNFVLSSTPNHGTRLAIQLKLIAQSKRAGAAEKTAGH